MLAIIRNKSIVAITAMALLVVATPGLAQTSKKKINNDNGQVYRPQKPTPTTPTIAPVSSPTLSALPALSPQDSDPNKGFIIVNLLRDAVAGKFLVKAEGGYLYQFASSFKISDSDVTRAENPLGVAVGGSIAYENISGFGISADYFGIYNNWSTGTLEGDSSYTQWLNIISIAPTYRVGFGLGKYFGIKFGLGAGMSISTLTVAHGTHTVAENLAGEYGFLLAPLFGVEFDNGVLHLDINGKYIHSFFNVGYGNSKQYVHKAGPIGAYVGLGLGLNF